MRNPFTRTKTTSGILAAALFISSLAGACLAAGCRGDGLDPGKPVTLTMWHNFGGQSQRDMNALLDEFNATVGKERGVIINVTAVTSSAEMADTLAMIAAGDPGSPEMPDLAVCYPRSAVLFQAQGKLANLDSYFTPSELSEYVSAFIDEGRFGDGGLYVFPFAKSTEVLYVNKTLFDAFSAETGVGEDCFASFEGISRASRLYYDWTDAKTPDVILDGKGFFAADSWFNLAQTGMLSMGDSLFLEGGLLNLDSASYRRIWDAFYEPALLGAAVMYRGYSSDLSKTGDVICSTGSSAGILIYGDTVTYPDNRTEKVEYAIYPYPIFEGGKKTVLQRGSGFIVAASEDTRKEYAAAVFLKWFTSTEVNMRFVSSTGYLPVTNAAFTSGMTRYANDDGNPNVERLLETFLITRRDYEFYVPPVFDEYDTLAKEYQNEWIAYLSARRDRIRSGEGVENAEWALEGFMLTRRPPVLQNPEDLNP